MEYTKLVKSESEIIKEKISISFNYDTDYHITNIVQTNSEDIYHLIQTEKLLNSSNESKNQIIEIDKTKKCDCEFDSQIAYVVNNITDEPEYYVSIIDYLKSKKLQKKIKEKEQFLVCEDGNELVKYESNKKKVILNIKRITIPKCPNGIKTGKKNLQK
jgi:hypothetical protein